MIGIEKVSNLKSALQTYKRCQITRAGLSAAKATLTNLLMSYAPEIVESLAEASEEKERLMEQIDALEKLCKRQKKTIDRLQGADKQETAEI